MERRQAEEFAAMILVSGPAKKLTIYVVDGDTYMGRPVHKVLGELFMEKGMAGMTMVHGVAGYGPEGRYRTASLLRLSENLPLKLEVIDEEEKIESVLGEVCRIVTKGLVTVSDTDVVHCRSGNSSSDDG